MTRLVAYLVITGFTVSAGLWLAESTSKAVKNLNAITAAKCERLNAITAGSCVMP
jgi:hypothetical protein